MTLNFTDRSKLSALDPNLISGAVADPALRYAVFHEIYSYLDNLIGDGNAFQATGAVKTINLQDGSVLTVKLADSAVTGPKILDGAVITAKLADGSVTTLKVQDGAIVTAKLADGSVTNAKLANSSVDLAKVSMASLDTRYALGGTVTGLQTQVTNNVNDLSTHKSSTTAHDATNLTYTGSATGANIKAAIDYVNNRLTGAIAANTVTEVSDSRTSIEGTVYPLLKTRLDTEFINSNALATASDANLMKMQYMSGVVDYVSLIKTNFDNSSTASVGTIQVSGLVTSIGINEVILSKTKALLNGYMINVVDGTIGTPSVTVGTNHVVNALQLSPPPTYGTRDDLVFLEGWFPTTGTTGQMSWRIRTVAGVDFSYAPEGFAYPLSGGNGVIAQAQGGNAQPLNNPAGSFATDPIHAYSGFYSLLYRTATIQTGKKIAMDDQGLYVAGDGSATAKTTLATADGYVYAIPLFKVQRKRNSGGYGKGNLSGARDYYNVSYSAFTNFNNGTTIQRTVTSTEYNNIQVGDKFVHSSNSTITLQVVSKDGSNNVTVLNTGITIANAATTTYNLISDRPDGLYSNIIDASDIIDLRHQIPTNVLPSTIVEGGFDSLTRGALITKDTKTTTKDVFGLRRAPAGVAQELRPTRIQRADGSFVDLVDLLGVDGNFEGGLNGWTGGGNTADTTTYRYGKGSLKQTGTSNLYAYKDYFGLDTTKYYVAITDVNITAYSASSAPFIRAQDGGSFGVNVVSQNFDSTKLNQWQTGYVKLTGKSSVRLQVGRFSAGDNWTLYADGIRLIPITQAEYNLIDVDANWTGGDKIAALYPYTESLPNVVENLLPDFTQWTLHANAVVTNANILTLNATANAQTSYVIVPVLANQVYVISMTAPATGSYLKLEELDASNAVLSTPKDNGINPYTYTASASVVKLRVFVYGQNGAGTYVFSNIQMEKQNTAINQPSPFVPYGREYLDRDYLANAHLNNGQLPTYHFEGVNGGSLGTQRLTFSDAMTPQVVNDVVDPTWNGINKPKHIIPTQATTGVWASGDTVKLHSDYGVITGLLDGDTAFITASDTPTTSTIVVSDVSKLAVNDTFKLLNVSSTGAILTNSGEVTITAIDTNTKTLTVSTNLQGWTNATWTTYLFETTTATSVPIVAYTAQQGKTAQSGNTSTTLKMASDASAVDSYYNNLIVTITAGTGIGQSKTITGYVGATKVATVSAWTTTPDTTSVYSISAAGAWSGLGTKDAIFTFGTMPTAVDATLGNANALNATIPNTVVYPAGKGISQVATDVLKVDVNGQELLSTNTISVKANFAGKVAGNTDLVPHIFKVFNSSQTGLQVPASGFFAEGSVAAYANISILDGLVAGHSTSTNLAQAQHLIPFDVIRAIEDCYGEIPADGVAAKVAWVKANTTQVIFDWYGYGSSPTGNKATVACWTNSSWNTIWGTTTNGVVTKISNNHTSSGINATIDANGMWYMLAYADASDGVTASTINTDYVELSITLKTANVSAYDSSTDSAGYTVLQPTNAFPVLSENMLTANQAFLVDWNAGIGGTLGTGTITPSIDSLGVLKVITDGTAVGQGVYLGVNPSIPANTYLTFKSRIKFPIGTAFYLAFYSGASSVGITNYTGTGDWQDVSTIYKDPSAAITAVYIRSANAVATTFYVGQSKVQQGVVATDWSTGRRKKVTLNMLGKVSGSVVENPHQFRQTSSPSLALTPTAILGGVERTQAEYDQVSKQDGVLAGRTTSVAGEYPQMMWEFDLSYLGLSLAELKKAFRRFDTAWVGYGSGDSASVLTYGATVQVWRNDTSAWTNFGTNITSTPSSITNNTVNPAYISNSQKVYVLVTSTYPASATNPSTLYTDYPKLDVTLADYVDFVPANIVKVRPETKEIKTFFPNVSRRYLGHQGFCGEYQIALHYRYVPYQGQGSIAKSKILAVGTPIITTLGTGASPSDTSAVNAFAMSTRLPSPVQDYNLIAEKFTSEGISTTIDSLLLKQNAIIPLSTSYRLTPKAGLYFDTNSAVVETVVRGASSRASFSTDTIIASVGQAVYKFSLPTTLPSEALISLPMLVVDNGELKMVVVSFRKSKSSVLQYYSDACVWDSFKLAGRPLCRL